MDTNDLMQIMNPQDIRMGLHVVIVRNAPEYFQQELNPDQPVSDLPQDWADAIEDERSLAESIEVYPQQITRADLLYRVSQHLELCRSQAWKRVSPSEVVSNVSRVIYPAGSKSA
jgi:hypothetical protein